MNIRKLHELLAEKERRMELLSADPENTDLAIETWKFLSGPECDLRSTKEAVMVFQFAVAKDPRAAVAFAQAMFDFGFDYFPMWEALHMPPEMIAGLLHACEVLDGDDKALVQRLCHDLEID